MGFLTCVRKWWMDKPCKYLACHMWICRMIILDVGLKMRFTLDDPKFFMIVLTVKNVNVRLQSGNLKMKFFACLSQSEVRRVQ